jgi:hypothetical protein
MKKLIVQVLGIAAILLLAAGTGHAAEVPPTPAHGPAFVLSNASNARLVFETMDPARQTWKAQKLFPHQKRHYAIASGHTEGRLRIATTGRGQVVYTVRAGATYKLVWDAAKGVWDLRLVTHPSLPTVAPAR